MVGLGWYDILPLNPSNCMRQAIYKFTLSINRKLIREIPFDLYISILFGTKILFGYPTYKSMLDKVL